MNNTATDAGGGLYLYDGTVTVKAASQITANIAPAGSGGDVYLRQKFYDTDFSVLYLEGNSTLGDVYDGGTLYKDSTSTIVNLYGNNFIPF
jgi:hypothetical protein